jgi:hypothetical protein
MTDSESENSDAGNDKIFDKELIQRIIEIQELSEEVVIKFIKAAGSLFLTDFGKNYLDGN